MLRFTGERFLPGEGGAEIYYEHAHRYLLAARLAANRKCLDVGSGEGYGAAWLAGNADSVVGIDIDSDAVAHASQHYASVANLQFRQGSAEALQFGDCIFGLVTCFETIEHVERPWAIASEIARVLAPGGVAMISTPDKAVYTDARPGYHNEFHLSEMYVPEFRELLGKYFQNVVLLGQRLVGSSLVWPIETTLPDVPPKNSAEILLPPHHSLDTPAMYIVALCSHDPIRPDLLPGWSTFLDDTEPLLDAKVAAFSDALREADSRERAARAQLDSLAEEMARLRAALSDADDRELRARTQLQQNEQVVEALNARLMSVEEELELARRQVTEVGRSLSERLASRLPSRRRPNEL